MFYNIVYWIMYPIFKMLFWFKIENKPKKLPEGNLIICANHKSNLDPLIVALSSDRKINFMAKKELFRIKIFSKFFYRLGAFPVDRQGNDIESVRKALKILKEKKVLGIFPEGTRIRKQEEIKLENFNDGVAMIASRSNTNIIPIEIRGDYKLFGKLRVIYKDVINIEDYKHITNKTEQYDKITEDIFNKIYNN